MKLVTFEHRATSRIGALYDNQQIVDLHIACALHMRALFRGGDTSLNAARKALDYATTLAPATRGPRGEQVFFTLNEAQLKAPIIPKKFFHTAGNFREHHEEATKAGFSHPVMPWIVFFQNVDAIIGHEEPVIYPE